MTDNKGNNGSRNIGSRNIGHYNNGGRNIGICNNGERNIGSRNIGICNNGDYNYGDRNNGERNNGDCNNGCWNFGNHNNGNWNFGNYNTGFFNTATHAGVQVFNGPIVSRSAFLKACPDWLLMPNPTSWISVGCMTDAEKERNETYKTTGGYLRTNNYLEEWQRAYDTASPADIQAVRDLPGFDAAVFKKITGLDLSVEPKSDGKPQYIEVDGVRYTRES